MNRPSVYIARFLSWVLDKIQLRMCHKLGYESRWVDTSLGRVHALCYEGEGDLPPVLLVHGLSSSAQDFEPLMRQIRGSFRQIIAIDLVGHGLSYRPEVPPTAEDLRTALAETAMKLLNEPAVVYGNSLGGYASICLALDHPELVRQLLLSSPGGAPMSQAELMSVLSVFQMRTHQDAMAFMDRIMETRSWWTPLMAQSCLGRLSAPHMKPLLGRIAQSRLLTADDVSELSVPVVVMWGKGERLLPESSLNFFKTHCPKGTQFEFPERAGHVPHADRPSLVGRRLRALAQLGASSRL